MIIKSIYVDAWQPPIEELRVIQEEAEGREILVTVIGADGQPLDLTGKTVSAYMEKPDGTIIFNTCEVDGATVTITLTYQMMAVSGCSKLFELQIIDTNSHTFKVTLPTLRIVPSNYDGAIESTNEFSRLSDALAHIDDATQDAETATGSANNAASAANSAAETATNAASAANTAAGAANTAAGTANTAAETATNAATAATNAASSASSAAETATNAANSATSAANAANTAAGAADTATSAANSAASSANSAASAATSAVETATNAANAATTAAGAANTAAGTANTAAGTATDAATAANSAASSATSAANAANTAADRANDIADDIDAHIASVAVQKSGDTMTGALNLNVPLAIASGGTGSNTSSGAFSNIVSPGGVMTGALTMNNNVSVNSKLSDGTTANLIGRNTANNLWIGTADEGVMEKQGSVYLATSDTGNAYVSRNNVRDKILDYGFVGKLLWEGNWSSGTISIPETSQYTLFMMYTLTSTGSNMATPILGMKYNTSWIRGPGAYNSSTTLFISTVAITLSGNSWELQQVISNNFTSDVKSNIIISRIYGLI